MSKYLSKGTILGGHYKVLDILGEDDFEILYLVKNIHREGSFFVIKELFLEVFSKRKGNSVETIPEAQGVFNKRKDEIKNEIDNIHKRHIEHDIKVFAYFEENNTIYTCMAYTPNAKVEDYLQFEPKEDTKLPLLEELMQKEIKNTSSKLWIGFMLIALMGGFFLAFNQYIFPQKEHKTNHVNLKTTKEKNSSIEKIKRVEKIVKTKTLPIPIELNKTKIEKKIDLLENNFSSLNVTKKIDENLTEDRNLTKKIDENLTEDRNLTKKIDENSTEDRNLTKKIDENSTEDRNLIKKDIIKVDESNKTEILEKETKNSQIAEEKNESNVTDTLKINQKDNNLTDEIFSKSNVGQFLHKYIDAIAHASYKEIMKLYDDKVDRYFQFKNITSKRVGKSVRIYNRKWKHKKFKLLKFKILKKYRKDGVDYCNIETHTKWSVSNLNGKRKKGYSKEFIMIKDTKDGFRVKAIYGIK